MGRKSTGRSGDVDRDFWSVPGTHGDVDSIPNDASERQYRSSFMPADSPVAHYHITISWWRFDYGFQRSVPIRWGVGGSGLKVRCLEQRVSHVERLGDFCLH